MKSDAIWLLKRQSFLIAREQVLLQLIERVDDSVPDDQEIIEGIAFARGDSEGIQRTAARFSRTEYAALNMETLRTERMEEQERRKEQWKKELRLIRNWLGVLEAALLVLTPEERKLAKRHYREGKSLEELSQIPLQDVIRSRSTLRRMQKRIIRKVEEVISREEGHKILPRI